MIAVTERAKQELKKILDDNADDPKSGLRLCANQQGQLGIALDMEIPGDNIIEYSGSKVLMVETELADQLVGITIDIQDTPEGPGLVLLNEPLQAEG